MTPECGVLNEVLQIAICCAPGIAEPRRHKDADRRQTLGMNIEESKNLRLWIAEGVPYGAGFKRGFLGQLNYKLHAQRPLALVVPRRHSEVFVDGLAYCAER